MRARYGWEAALVGVAVVWGSTFVVVQDAVEDMPPFLFLALRFALASLVMAALGGFRRFAPGEMRAGTAAGVALFAGYAFQTIGLQYTSSSNAGFITGLFVVFTPLIGAVVARRLPSGATLGGAALATAGLALLSLRGGFLPERGDALVLGAAAAFAAHIVVLGRVSAGRSALRLASVQVAVTALLSMVWSAAAERTAPAAPADVWGAIALTGVLASALAFFVQTAAQKIVPPTRTAIILTSEPVFAGVFGFWLAGERLTGRGYAGAALILVGIVVAEALAPEREAV